MLLAYIDESYDDDDYWLTALLVPDTDHASLSKRLRGVADKAVTAHGLDSSAEFRGYDVFHGEREWEPLKAAPRQRIGIYKAVLDAVAQAGCRVIVAGAVRAATEKRWPGYHPTEHAHRVAFFGLLTEVAAHCTAKEERALLIADEVSGSSAVLLRQDVRWLQERERPDLDTSRLIDTVHFIRSHESVLVQAADMVGFIHRRANARKERDSRAEATNRLLSELIEPLVIARRRWPDQPLI